ncbi:hypothetical protein [Roseateles asaccharophilus]|uniref:Uncharacterized protein n=1 Tax=Roseateles asaccharophilus TaxID=582607 RepID=A0ABU2A3K3_9BURK|nr:hypothetical protein [Roseateles asaccharophilus]MDR7331770.1 hypothetical protein [Roseateles asaccharophilus]
MADLSPYIPDLDDEDYVEKIAAAFTLIDGFLDEIEAGRDGQASLAANFARYIRAAAGLQAALAANGHKITGLGAPTAAGDAVTKAYADGLAFSSSLPAQAGNNGAVISTDGTTAYWTFDYARKNGSASETFSMATQASTDASKKGANTEFVQERCGLNAETLFYRG